MKIYIQQKDGLKPIGGGGKEAQQELEERINRIEQTQATEDTAGIVTLCDLPGVSDSTGKALPSSEKNAARKGSMAHAIAQLQGQNRKKDSVYLKNYTAADSRLFFDSDGYINASVNKAGVWLRVHLHDAAGAAVSLMEQRGEGAQMLFVRRGMSAWIESSDFAGCGCYAHLME